MRLDPKAPVRSSASRILRVLAEDLFLLGRASLSSTEPTRLHGLRRTLKRLRDSMLLFEKLYGARMRDYLAILVEAQDKLGYLQDLAAVRTVVSKRPAGIDHTPLIEALDLESAFKVQEFHEFWKQRFGSESQMRRWTSFLGQFEGDEAG